MRFSTEVKKLEAKIKNLKQRFVDSSDLPSEKLILKEPKIYQSEKHRLDDLIKDLTLLKKIYQMIEQDATGYDLAYEVDKNHYVNKLINDGVLFYRSFIEIGNKKFKDAPDKKKVKHQSFLTVEDTEKYLFMIWLKETITKLKEAINDSKNIIEKKRKKICVKCGADIKDYTQNFCEQCGIKI